MPVHKPFLADDTPSESFGRSASLGLSRKPTGLFAWPWRVCVSIWSLAPLGPDGHSRSVNSAHERWLELSRQPPFSPCEQLPA